MIVRLRSLVLVLLGSLAGLGAPAAQEGQAPPTVAEVEARLAELEEQGGEPAEAQVPVYTEALATLRRAADRRARASDYRAEAAESPALLEALRTELAEAPPDVEEVAAADVGLRELEASLEEARGELLAARAEVEELDALADQRRDRRAELPEESASADAALAEAREALAAGPTGERSEARRALLLARVEDASALVELLDAERADYDARREVLPLRRDRAQRRLTRAEALVGLWREAVDARRAREAAAAEAEAAELLQETMLSFPSLREIAERTRELTSLRSGSNGLPQRISSARATRDGMQATREEIEARFDAANRRVSAGGLTEAMGLTLRRDYEWLPGAADLRGAGELRERALGQAELEQLELEEEDRLLGDVPAAVQRLLAEFGDMQPPDGLAETATELLEAQRDARQAALDDFEVLTTTLYEQQSLASRLFDSAAGYRAFIEERILWVRSAPANPWGSLRALPGDTLDLAGEAAEADLLRELRRSAIDSAGLTVLSILLAAVLYFGRRALRRRRSELAGLVRSYRTDRYVYTVRALFLTLLIAAPVPLVAWTAGWLFSSSMDPLALALGVGLKHAAATWIVLRFVRGLLADKSVGQGHFKWPAGRVAALKRELVWFEPLAAVLVFVFVTLDSQENTTWSDSLGRAAFVAGMAALAIVARRLTHSESESRAATSGRHERSLVARTQNLWAPAAVAAPVALGLLALGGYYYTALQFDLRLRLSIAFALGLVLVNALLLRWLFMARRKLAIAQAIEARARREEEQAGAGGDGGAQPLDADQVDIPAADAQTRQLFRSGIAIALLFGLYFLWSSALPALKGLNRVQLLPTPAILADAGARDEMTSVGADTAASEANGSETAAVDLALAPGLALPEESGGLGLPTTLTLADVLLALVFLVITSVAARNLPALLELSLLQRLPLDSGARYAVATILRYVIALIGLSAISGALGVGWQEVQWLAAALTFGLAFGLQEIFANFVSGLIILIERPVRVGDVVTVDGIEGRVTQLRMRATTIQDYDRREFLVPNKDFITGRVVNWSLSDPVTRVVVPVGIAYGSDTELARSLLLRVAAENRTVLSDPKPQAIFRTFGESTLDFELRVFFTGRELWPEVYDQLNTAIDRAFRAANIEIAFPQRDVWIRSADDASGGADA